MQFHRIKLSKTCVYLLDNALLNIIAVEAWGQGKKHAGRGWVLAFASFAPTLSLRTRKGWGTPFVWEPENGWGEP